MFRINITVYNLVTVSALEIKYGVDWSITSVIYVFPPQIMCTENVWLMAPGQRKETTPNVRKSSTRRYVVALTHYTL